MALLFNAIGEQRFGTDTCFLCGVSLTIENRSDEHVFPKWLQRRHNLWNHRLELVNGTKIPYRQITIPACTNCNSVSLGDLESDVERATEEGIGAVLELDKLRLFQWASKLYYGVLVREGLLRSDRSNPTSRPIIPSDFLEEIETLHYFLQGVRVAMKFPLGIPASVFVFECQEPMNEELQFDFRDDVLGMSIAVRTKRVGIIATLGDGGAVRRVFGDSITNVAHFPLHPIQFRELSAVIFYHAARLEHNQKYVLIDGGAEITTIAMPMPHRINQSPFRDWDEREFAARLSKHVGVPLDNLYNSIEGTLSCLIGPDGRPKFLPIDDDASSGK